MTDTAPGWCNEHGSYETNSERIIFPDCELAARVRELEAELEQERTKVRHYEETVCLDDKWRALPGGVNAKEIGTIRLGDLFRKYRELEAAVWWWFSFDPTRLRFFHGRPEGSEVKSAWLAAHPVVRSIIEKGEER